MKADASDLSRSDGAGLSPRGDGLLSPESLTAFRSLGDATAEAAGGSVKDSDVERARQKREEKEEAPGPSSEGEGFGEAVVVASTGKSVSELPTHTDPVPMSLDEHFKQEIENGIQKIKVDEEEGKVGRGELDERKRMMQQKVKAQLGALLPHASDADLERLVRRFGPDESTTKFPFLPKTRATATYRSTSSRRSWST